MNKKELITAVANQSGISQKEVQKVLDSIIYQICENVGHEEVKLLGFGSFSLKHKVAHTARNPKTGQQVSVPAKKMLHFKASKTLNQLFGELYM